MIDWSSQNVIAAGHFKGVYCARLEDDKDNEAFELLDVFYYANVGAVQFSKRGEFLAVGKGDGLVQIWDLQARKLITKFDGNSGKVYSIAWNDSIVCGGCSDGTIHIWDIREKPEAVAMTLKGPAAVGGNPRFDMIVSGLKWSPDKQQLASCGGDKTVKVWNLRKPEPCVAFAEHTAHVKAISWSPHHRGLLTTGGGRDDGTLRFWDTIAGVPLQRVITGRSQICSVAWSKHSAQLVTAHGYDDSGLMTWKYPSLRRDIDQPTPLRLVYMAMSPDGESIVTGSGFNLEFWRVFNRNDDNNH